MGRNVKRVHIDFDWFEKTSEDNGWAETWKGYILDEMECPLCDGKGKNTKGKRCPECYGEGKTSPRIEPPEGYDWEKTSGYQIWQDVSEGSPVSPVFLKPKDLAKWMVENDTSVTRDCDYKSWLNMIKKESSAPSMIIGSEGIKSGVAAFN